MYLCICKKLYNKSNIFSVVGVIKWNVFEFRHIFIKIHWIHFLTCSTTSSLDIELVTSNTIVLASSLSIGSIILAKCCKLNNFYKSKSINHFLTYIHHICSFNISLISLQHSGPPICNMIGQLHDIILICDWSSACHVT